MIIGIIAVDDSNGIGKDNGIPWPKNTEDLKWFKNCTEHNIVFMGKNTWFSKGMPKPLPNRLNIVATNSDIDTSEAVVVSGDICEAIHLYHSRFTSKDLYVIGGANILMQAKPVLDKIYITRISGNYDCDVILDIDTLLEGFYFENEQKLKTCIVEEYERI